MLDGKQAAIDKVVAELRSLRSKGLAFYNEVDAVGQKVNSEMNKAVKCKICVMLADNDANTSS